MGGLAFSATPAQFGPRNWGQLSVALARLQIVPAENAARMVNRLTRKDVGIDIDFLLFKGTKGAGIVGSVNGETPLACFQLSARCESSFSYPVKPMKKILATVFWVVVALAGAGAYVTMAMHRGETLNSAYILIAALCSYAIGYRFYFKWIAARVLRLNY